MPTDGIPDREEAIIRAIEDGASVSIERALLVLSGLQTESETRSYRGKIDTIYHSFRGRCANHGLSEDGRAPAYWHRSIARCLFDYLWNSKPKRFGESFLLTEVVDAQLDPGANRPVGTCVGLTSLYSVLGLRAGLNLSLLVGPDHVLSRLRLGEQTVDMDHTDPQGFDAGNGEGFREFPLLTLTANVLNSRGLDQERNGRLAAAGADYHKALRVNPEYASAYNNRGNMRFRDGALEGAIADYNEAIRINPRFCEAYCNRGIARQRLGHCQEARQDYLRALDLNAEYGDARRYLESMGRSWGRSEQENIHNTYFSLT